MIMYMTNQHRTEKSIYCNIEYPISFSNVRLFSRLAICL